MPGGNVELEPEYFAVAAFAMSTDVADTSITWGGNAGDDTTQGTGIDNTGATGDGR
jgi:hypothetical protein